MSAEIDVLVLLHNEKHLVLPLMRSLKRMAPATPHPAFGHPLPEGEGKSGSPVAITIYFLDNGSKDGTPDALAAAAGGLPFRTHLFRSLHNNGFARGMNLLSRQGSGEFLFVLNPDTVLENDCLEKLVSRMQENSQTAICEARQAPREHPKAHDPSTGETSWCSGAAALIRRKAFEQVGGFDERLFYMYCEDVDLSWKFWLTGWRCIYVRDAVVNHYTQDVVPGKKRTQENYFSFRNSLFLFYRFGSWKERNMLWRFLRSRFISRSYSLRSKVLFAIAFADHIRYIPYLLRTRRAWSNQKHPWVRLNQTSLAG